MSDKALINELRALRNEVSRLRKSGEDRARYERYLRLKESGELSMNPVIGRGMPTVPSYSEWDGMSYDEAKEMANWYAVNDRR